MVVKLLKGGEAMNIGLVPFIAPQSSSIQMLGGGQKTSIQQSQKFGEVFQQVAGTMENQTEESAEGQDLMPKILDAETVEELFEELGITYEDGFVFPEEGRIIPLEDLVNMEEMIALFPMDLPQLNEIVQRFLGEDVEIENISDLLQKADFEALQNNIISSLEKGGKEAEDAMRFLQLVKLTQVTSEKTGQPVSEEVKELLETVTKEVKITKQETQGAVQNIIKQVETLEVPNQTPQTVTRTVTITLPNENRTSQGEELMKQIETLISRSALSSKQGTIKLLLKLNPENLGSIRIELVQKQGMLSARMLTSTAIGKEMLDSHLNQLKQALLQQNISFDRIDIGQSLQETDLRDQSLFGNLFKQQSQREDNQNKRESSEETDHPSFQEILENQEV